MITLLSSFQFAFLLILMKLMCLGAPGYALINVYLWPSKVAAAIVWGTIDDQLGDSVTHRLVNYYPTQNVWANQTCGGNNCKVVPDKSQAFDNTYTAGTYDPEKISIGINMQFTGRLLKFFCFDILIDVQQEPRFMYFSSSEASLPPIPQLSTAPTLHLIATSQYFLPAKPSESNIMCQFFIKPTSRILSIH